MANTVFMAVQCCQCSIMQVKQRKKSSNKWTCVVCDQKQSVRKVFAQGYAARDLRQFVQAFNMSQSQQPQQGDGFQPSFEMETPNKKPKFNHNHTTGEERCQENEHVGACADSIWHIIQDDKEPMTCQATMTKAASKWSNYMTQDNTEPRTYQPKATNSSSKWSGYLTQDFLAPSIRQPKKTEVTSKWSKYMTEDDVEQRASQPTMTKAALNQSHYTTQADKEPLACRTTTKAVLESGEHITDDEKEQRMSLPKRCDHITEDEKEQGTHLPAIRKAASKWNNYLTQDED